MQAINNTRTYPDYPSIRCTWRICAPSDIKNLVVVIPNGGHHGPGEEVEARFIDQLNGSIALLGTTLAFATDSKFVYEKNQAISQVNECSNDELALNVGCQNVKSQIQGYENAVGLAADQVFL